MTDTAATGRLLTGEQLAGLLPLLKDADSVELKLTIPESHRQSAITALEMDPLDAQLRQVFFFDTPDLHLYHAGVVVRARRVQGRANDSVVKLRPVDPGEVPSHLRKHPDFVVEVDAMPGGFVCSGSFKARLGGDEVPKVVRGEKEIRKLYTREQRDFFAEHGPEGIALDQLSVLGPINVVKLKFAPTGFDRPMVAELWNYPDGSRILELSTKCAPADGFAVAAEAKAFLYERGIDTGGEQQTKTRTALEIFSKELIGAPPTDDQSSGAR